MRKKLKNMLCVYCGSRAATTEDHVFARAFFLVVRRGNLPKVPACQSCNNVKSELENYLAAVLPFGARHADAATNLLDAVPPRLANNMALHRKLVVGISRVWTCEGGVSVPTSTLPFEPEKLGRLFGFIAKALAWLHWGVAVATDADPWAGVLNGTGERLLSSWMRQAKVRVTGNPGSGTFTYEGVQAADNPRMTIWTFTVYGGVKLTGDPDAPYEEVSRIGVVTGSKRFMEEFRNMVGEPAVA